VYSFKRKLFLYYGIVIEKIYSSGFQTLKTEYQNYDSQNCQEISKESPLSFKKQTHFPDLKNSLFLLH